MKAIVDGLSMAAMRPPLHTRRTFFPRISMAAGQHEREDSNPIQQFWRLPALPGASLVYRSRKTGTKRIARTTPLFVTRLATRVKIHSDSSTFQ